jgi:hypothetical protein
MQNIQDQTITKKDLSISLAAANLYSIPMIIIPAVIFGIPYYLLWGTKIFGKGAIGLDRVAVIVLVFISGAVVHELIHALSWKIWGKKSWEKIKFGFSVNTLTPYVHCKEPITAHAYKIGTAAPGLIMGIIPLLVSIASGNEWIFWFGMLFTISAAGDFMILWLIRKVTPDTLVEDHPSRAGCYIYEETILVNN